MRNQAYALRKFLLPIGALLLICGWAFPLRAQLTSESVQEAIDRAKAFLVKAQRKDETKKNGSWASPRLESHSVGVTSLALLALINSGMTIDEEPIARGLAYLRRVEEPGMTYDISLLIMTLTVAKDGARDNVRLQSLVSRLEETQLKKSDNAGSWSYGLEFNTGGDRSNSQFAVLALREAQHAGITVNRATWERAREYWTTQQNGDGGWGYTKTEQKASRGSMTVAGISALIIIDAMLRNEKDENPDGTPNCCGRPEPDKALERALAWFERDGNFSVRSNPRGGAWWLYYLYGLERAGRMSGRRYFSQHDWYREGAEFLLKNQSMRSGGSWAGEGSFESDPVVGTSLALLFLSKGLAPVLINKLKYGPHDPARPDRIVGEQWNLHPNDVRNLTEMISGLPEWPKLLTTQEVDIGLALAHGGVQDLMQAPILFINGSEAHAFDPQEIELLREYVTQGGFILAEAACTKTNFDRGFRELIGKMYPDGDYQLKRLSSGHPVFRSEYLIDAETTELWGVDVGCRTSIMYSPQDLACLWDKWTTVDPPGRTAAFKEKLIRATEMGVNIVAYATGREPPNKLELPELLALRRDQKIERGLLQIAKLRHNGGWDSAPHALRNLLVALNSYAGVAASTQANNLRPDDPNLFKFPLVYMHGGNAFQLSRPEQERLLDYLERGGVLFADACCGSPQFDGSFRDLMKQMFPNEKLKRIPSQHELFTPAVGHNLERVERREPESSNPNQALRTHVVQGEPYLEGIEHNGRYIVIYSKYDISCALERQASVACTGYVHKDAVKIAINIILYALLQNP